MMGVYRGSIGEETKKRKNEQRTYDFSIILVYTNITITRSKYNLSCGAWR